MPNPTCLRQVLAVSILSSLGAPDTIAGVKQRWHTALMRFQISPLISKRFALATSEGVHAGFGG